MINKVYKEWVKRRGQTKAKPESLEEEIRMLSDLDFTFQDMILELGVQELAKHIALKTK